MWSEIQAWLAQNLLSIIFIIVGAFLFNKFVPALVAAVFRRLRYRAHGDTSDEDVFKRQNTLISMFTAVLKVLVWVIAISTILGYFNIDLAPLIASAGIIGVAIGFGAQSLIKDFISGIFIILENQYRVGDNVELDGASGTVEQISVRTTVLRDTSGNVHYIPNGIVTHSINKSKDYSKVNLLVSVSPEADVDKLIEVVDRVGEKLAKDEKWSKKIIEPPHFYAVNSFSNTALEIKIIGKTRPAAQWSVSGELRKRILAEFKKQKFGISAFVNQDKS
ncbi:MAG TPA: mechanosensitive ion channel family protein [Candidatus Saccharimonadales bacterium]|nr:mechanosensitive ion channel family protein [Candidatus Saccharimonadales bacterium]